MSNQIPADRLLEKIEQLLTENQSSLLGFKTEKQKAQELVAKQHEKIEKLQMIHVEIAEMAEQEGTSLEDFRTTKESFNRSYQEYKEEYALLRELFLTISVSYTTEKYVIKRCFLKESDQLLTQLIEKADQQDLRILQLNDLTSSLD
ncbi:hypothetical protein [Enterococcus sp. AZ072]|uniref:hypothetical protein n=1 Tax=unclassified Enterococcus TaxID=2608891 RepID=UPI003D2DBC73